MGAEEDHFDDEKPRGSIFIVTYIPMLHHHHAAVLSFPMLQSSEAVERKSKNSVFVRKKYLRAECCWPTGSFGVGVWFCPILQKKSQPFGDSVVASSAPELLCEGRAPARASSFHLDFAFCFEGKASQQISSDHGLEGRFDTSAADRYRSLRSSPPVRAAGD